MSTPVTYVGTQYNVPAYQDTGWAQGSGNLSSYLIALATGSLTLSGGSFPLTADADFGANFGLKSIYYKSRAANIGSTGILRVGNNEVFLAARNANNDGDVTLKVDTSNNVVLSGGNFSLGANAGIVFTTPDGTKTYKLYVDNNGELTTLELT